MVSPKGSQPSPSSARVMTSAISPDGARTKARATVCIPFDHPIRHSVVHSTRTLQRDKWPLIRSRGDVLGGCGSHR